MHALLEHYPERFSLPLPKGVYYLNDPRQSLLHFLSSRIKTGTDTAKSDTAIEAFRCVANQLCTLMCKKVKHFPRPVPSGKWVARRLHQKQFSPDQVRTILQENPTLAAQLMSTAVAVMGDRFRPNVSD